MEYHWLHIVSIEQYPLIEQFCFLFWSNTQTNLPIFGLFGAISTQFFLYIFYSTIFIRPFARNLLQIVRDLFLYQKYSDNIHYSL